MPELMSWLNLAIGVAAAIVIAVVITAVVAFVLSRIERRKKWPARLVRLVRVPFRMTLILVLVWTAIDLTLPVSDWRPGVALGFRVLFIAAFSWLLVRVAIFFIDTGLGRYRTDVPDNRVARRLRTQVLILRRLVVVIIVILAIGAILLSFPGIEALGTSVLASAGLLSIVAGLAAQSSLANVFAGMQLAFSDAIRVDDVVVVEGEWGRIEEITLTYVVVHIWDDRRMVLPSTWFTSTPFQNWTRRNSELLGAVELDLDWRVPVDDMREELARLLERTDLWDRRTSVLQVTDAVGGLVRIRILVTAVDAPTLFDLRCFVREGIVAWLQADAPHAIPRQRVQLLEDATESARPRPAADHPAPMTGEMSGLFTGDADAKLRADTLTGVIRLPDGRVERAVGEPDGGTPASSYPQSVATSGPGPTSQTDERA